MINEDLLKRAEEARAKMHETKYWNGLYGNTVLPGIALGKLTTAIVFYDESSFADEFIEERIKELNDYFKSIDKQDK